MDAATAGVDSTTAGSVETRTPLSSPRPGENANPAPHRGPSATSLEEVENPTASQESSSRAFTDAKAATKKFDTHKHIRTGIHFAVHWFGARRFDPDHDLHERDEASHGDAESSRQLVELLIKDNFKKKGKSKSGLSTPRSAPGTPGISRSGTASSAVTTPRSPRSAQPPPSPASSRPPKPEAAEAPAEEHPKEDHPQKDHPHEKSHHEHHEETVLEEIEEWMMDAHVTGEHSEEELVSQHWPIWVLSEMFVAFMLWVIFRIANGDPLAGFESIFPGRTLFVVHNDCTDHRHELWRWLTYQFSHVSASHIIVNCILLFVAGLPLEGFHGHWRIIAVFNLGVFGGALLQGVASSHTLGLAGMSAGCYALMAMHWGDIAMNWNQSKFRHMKLIMLVLLVLIDVLSTLFVPAGKHEDSVVSHFSHLGGFGTGFLMSILIVRNLEVSRGERIAQAVALMVFAFFVIFCGAWLAQWPPKALFDSHSWCWIRQANNQTAFGDLDWHCIRCQDDACIKRWSRQSSLHRVKQAWCDREGRWWN